MIGTLDTKGEAVIYVRDRIRALGISACVVDTSMRGVSPRCADVTNVEVARCARDGNVAGGDELDVVVAIKRMADGLSVFLKRRYAAGELVGAIAVGGAQGSAIAATAMQTLPLGLPKLMVSTMASGANAFGPYVGTSDMTLMHSVGDIIGVDGVSVEVLRNAAAAVSAMAREHARPPSVRLPPNTLGATMLGPTTACVTQAKSLLRDHDCDLVAFHANGIGGQCMDRMLSESALSGALELSPQELVGHVCHGFFDGGPARMTAAGSLGLPQVVAPGGTDYVVRGPVETLTDEQRSRPLVVHNSRLTRIRTTTDEMDRIGCAIADRLNQTHGEARVIIPLKGFSATDVSGGLFHDPDANSALIERLAERLDQRIELTCLDAHINSPEFAESVVATYLELHSV